jgi:hypothetical protein
MGFLIHEPEKSDPARWELWRICRMLNINATAHLSRTLLAVCAIAAVSAITYLPAVDNSFISDDFGIFPMIDALEQNPAYIFEATSELFRVTSYAWFWICMNLFALSAPPYYLAGIVLHALISVLIYVLVLRLTGRPVAALAAAIFFAAYERHQEAVMWISAANEMLLTLFCLLFLTLWERATNRHNESAVYGAAAFVALAFALFSKESAVALAPMAVVILRRHGYSQQKVIERAIPVFMMVVAFIVLWLSQADRNFFVTDSHYSAGLHFFPVYGRAVLRLLTPTIPFVATLVLLRYRGSPLRWGPDIAVFGSFLFLAIAPYCFLTYLDHLPSRHTYFPSMGLAGLIGILFAHIHERMTTRPLRQLAVAGLLLIITGNIGYIWFKKDSQYRERAAPTRELIATLNGNFFADEQHLPVGVCNFPLHPEVFKTAIARFTPLTLQNVDLRSKCTPADRKTLLIWDGSQYSLSRDVAAIP